MQTMTTENGTRFHFNGDFSGDVIISRDGQEIRVPYECVDNLVCERLSRVVVAKVEQMSAPDLVRLIGQSDLLG